ncbi:MAG: dTMP kinase [Congregibacter sp.]
MSQRGLFITVEGCEGVGKSTAMHFLDEALKDKGVALLTTREPGGTALGESLRNILLSPTEAPIVAHAELLMMFAARAQHIEERIMPALQSGHWVLSDRFTDASFAYQGGGRQLPMQDIAMLEDLVQGDLRPDITLLLDAPVETGLERARGRGALDRFERENFDFFERVRRAYLQRAEQGSGRYRVIDASGDLAHVQSQLGVIVDELAGCPSEFDEG